MLTTFLRSVGDQYSSNFWVSVPGLTSDSGELFNDVAVLSNGDIVAVGQIDNSFTEYAPIVRVSRQGRAQWRNRISAIAYAKGIEVDGSDNLYIGASEALGTGGIYGGHFLHKWDGDASAISWQTEHYFDRSTDFQMGNIARDSSGNIYTAGWTNDEGAGADDFLIAKFNSSGALQWDRTLGNASYDQNAYAVAADASGNVYVAGYTATASGWADAIVAKYNTSGTIQWQRKLSTGSSNVQYLGVGVDSSGNVYACGGVYFVKYNSSGTIQFQKTLTGASFRGMHITSGDRIFVVGTASSNLLAVEYNTSGAIQWQNTLDGGAVDAGLGITYDTRGNGAVVICGWTRTYSASEDAVIARLPDDGSHTGTYGSWTYAAAGLTAGTGSATDAVGGMTDAAAVLSTATPSHTIASATADTEYRTVFRP